MDTVTEIVNSERMSSAIESARERLRAGMVESVKTLPLREQLAFDLLVASGEAVYTNDGHFYLRCRS